ncbi:glycosyltransferase family 15 protein [Sistotremastrum niveocremeum HHB9708]|uniref:Glycosyltransferase family 15 protein n=1 Tax=Sistotremastrum niveocremeum HHB9708 TaxID=1314777 RepID=A0A164PLW0_9AGAM|nr:glycosyltransferase family 15 protein [Sistotremastrum niveocremeum HHB9708]
MMTPSRYLLCALSILVALHYILSFTHQDYGRATSLATLAGSSLLTCDAEPDVFNPPVVQEYSPVNTTTPRRKANAALVMLARNSDVDEVIRSMKRLEDKFNRKFDYPWVFLNDQPFNAEFKKRTRAATNSKVSYATIPHDDWHQPVSIDEERAAIGRQKLIDDDIIYAESVPYRNMCRFNSGFFYKQEILKDFKYYWRVEPGVKYFCDIDYDPFLLMQDEGKVYGFTISMYEYESTIASLWDTTTRFMRQFPEYLVEDNALNFISDNGGETYNLCHFWSNFEIGDLDFWRGEAYNKYFEYLDETGNFYYERWGDAPVHTLGAALFARKDQIHFFEDIGYRHEPFQHCPQGNAHAKGRCECDPSDNFDYEGYSCTKKWHKSLFW